MNNKRAIRAKIINSQFGVSVIRNSHLNAEPMNENIDFHPFGIKYKIKLIIVAKISPPMIVLRI